MKKTLFCLLSGLLFAVAYNWFFPLVFVAGIPLFRVLLSENTLKQRLLYVTVFSFGYLFLSYCWLYEFADVLEFGIWQQMLIVTIALIFICGVMTAFWLIPLAIFGNKLTKNLTSVVTISCILCLGEWLQGLFYPWAFPWARFANIVVPFKEFIQFASVFGGLFISFLVLFVNGLFALVDINFKNFHIKNVFRSGKKYFFGGVATIISVTIFGIIFLIPPGYGVTYEVDPNSYCNVLLIQGNFPGNEDFSTTEVFDTYVDLMETNIDEKTQLVITPEIAMKFDFYNDDIRRNRLFDICEKNNVILVMGVWSEGAGDEVNKKYNSMLCLYPDRTYSDVYSKTRLVPFSEKVMFREIINKIFPDMLNVYTVTEGSGAAAEQIFQTNWSSKVGENSRNMGGLICYESIFPEVARGLVKNNADFFALLTDDSWFGDTVALKQHLSHACLRAVENNVPILQCGNTGITAYIHNKGYVTEQIPTFEKGVLKVNVAVHQSDRAGTLYTKWGDIPVLIMFFGWLILTMILSKINYRKR